MSGHSKWSTIKRKKGAEDEKRGKLFSKLVREITISARIGGGDEEMNARLRSAIQAAKDANMPKDNIEKAILRGTGELPGVIVEEYEYEGYGPGGAAILLKVITDNKNRIVGEIRHIFEKYGGKLAKSGSVKYLFETKGLIVIERNDINVDKLLDLVLEEGADDIFIEGEQIEIYAPYENYNQVLDALDESGKYKRIFSEISMIPSSTIPVEQKDAEKLIKLIDILDEHDDVQKVWSNYEISDDILQELLGV
jgi:YebC/PmpR family DNA-binding regulatory protein